MADERWRTPLRIVQANLQVADAPSLDRDTVMRQLPEDLHANAILAAPQPMPVIVEGPHSVQLSAYRQRDGFISHLVNGTGVRPLQDTVPIYDVQVRLRLHVTPDQRARVEGALSGAEVRAVVQEDSLHFFVRRVDTWEIMRVCIDSCEPSWDDLAETAGFARDRVGQVGARAC